MNSLNHYAYGTVSRYFYEGILGIKPKSAGFKEITVSPKFGSQLTEVKGGYRTPHGEIVVSWQRNQQLVKLEVVVPKNTTVEIQLPQLSNKSLTLNGNVVTAASELKQLEAGTYQIEGVLHAAFD
ncbi:hypothetical protein NAF29_13545 [Echinimonas agarilytica]|uniref:Alpha-L-rhamnosidase C-terminal domain-containing protein n=1 Tax=Echinimonas agarilytica TaxID=1215918 RepID=A0AA41W8V2_9GAMM|nr:hypothetical protein [Echinimonas agarilytica]